METYQTIAVVVAGILYLVASFWFALYITRKLGLLTQRFGENCEGTGFAGVPNPTENQAPSTLPRGDGSLPTLERLNKRKPVYKDEEREYLIEQRANKSQGKNDPIIL